MKKMLSLLLLAAMALSLFTMTAFADEDRWIIPSVDVAVDVPTDGKPITDNCEISPLGEGYYIASVSWSPEHTTFKAGVTYTVTITAETEGEFTFDTSDPDCAFVNERRATILSCSADQMKFSLTFPPVVPNFIDVSYTYSAIQLELHENFTLEADYTLPAGAKNVKHQWYVGNTDKDWGTPIEGATGKTFAVPTDEEYLKYYRCHITCELDGDILSTPTEEFYTVLVEVKGFGMPSMFFEDVKSYDWFYKDVEFVYYDRLMVGIDDTHFGPDVPTTRGMIVTVLYRLEGQPDVGTNCPFSDVKKGSYYEKAIIWAEKNGIVYGMGDGTYEPDTQITREQLAAILCRYAKFKGVWNEDDCVMTGGFSDLNKVSSWASEDISWAVGSGMLAGSQEADGLYIMPQGNALRSHFAAMLHRFYKYFLEP